VNRHARILLPLLGTVLAALVAGGCSGGGRSSGRPHTDATLQIVAPAPEATTGQDVDVVMRLTGARLVPPTQVGGRLRGDEGHIHVLLDGQLVAMPLSARESLTALARGPHTVEAEFVASDHLAFANPVVAAVTFEVR